MYRQLCWNTHDRDILDGLRKKGFKLTDGPGGAGFASLLYTRGGGYYFGQPPSP